MTPVKTILRALALCVVAAAPLPAQSWGVRAGALDARIWVANERYEFGGGERVDVAFTVSRGAYVAIVHIAPDGRLDFLHPSRPGDVGRVAGGRVHSLARTASTWKVGRSAGVGYLYIVASTRPLDFSAFGGPFGSRWDWSYAGRTVRGDPYLALDQITEVLIPDPSLGEYAVDLYSYQVGGRYGYPRYACAAGTSGVWGWGSSFRDCGAVEMYLRQYPGYFDSRLGGSAWYPYHLRRAGTLPGGHRATRRTPGEGVAKPPARGIPAPGTFVPRTSGTARKVQPGARKPTIGRRGTTARKAPPQRKGGGGGATGRKSRGGGGDFILPASVP